MSLLFIYIQWRMLMGYAGDLSSLLLPLWTTLRNQFPTCKSELVVAKGSGKYHVGVDIIAVSLTT